MLNGEGIARGLAAVLGQLVPEPVRQRLLAGSAQPAFDSLGLAYEAVGDRAGALAAYRQVLKRAPLFAHAAERVRVLGNGQ